MFERILDDHSLKKKSVKKKKKGAREVKGSAGGPCFFLCFHGTFFFFFFFKERFQKSIGAALATQMRTAPSFPMPVSER